MALVSRKLLRRAEMRSEGEERTKETSWCPQIQPSLKAELQEALRFGKVWVQMRDKQKALLQFKTFVSIFTKLTVF